MRLLLKRRTSEKVKSRLKRKIRIRKKIQGSSERPRLSVFRSSTHIYAQIIDDVTGKTIVSASSLKASKKSGKDLAKDVGTEIAEKAIAKEIKDVVFDRGGFVYHGRIKVLAEAAREAGLKF